MRRLKQVNFINVEQEILKYFNELAQLTREIYPEVICMRGIIGMRYPCCESQGEVYNADLFEEDEGILEGVDLSEYIESNGDCLNHDELLTWFEAQAKLEDVFKLWCRLDFNGEYTDQTVTLCYSRDKGFGVIHTYGSDDVSEASFKIKNDQIEHL